MTYQIGQKMPYIAPRGLTGEELEKSRWHALRVAPGQEKAKAEMLKAEGIHAFFPTEERQRWRHGQKIVREHPTVTQIVYAKFRQVPHWDVLRERRIITGVFCNGGRPIILPGEVIRSIQGLPTRAELLRQAKAEMLALRPGDRAELIDGPLAGIVVEVETVRDRRVWWAGLFGRGSSDLAMMSGRMEPISVERVTRLAEEKGPEFAEACVTVSEQEFGIEALEPARRALEALGGTTA